MIFDKDTWIDILEEIIDKIQYMDDEYIMAINEAIKLIEKQCSE